MPTKNEAMQKPSNLGEVIQPATPYAQNVPPIIPREQPGLGPASLGPAPATWTTDYDKVRQWSRPGTSQARFPVLPTKNNPQLNASSSGVAARKVRPIAAQSSANAAAIVALRAASVFEGTWSSTTSYVAGNSVLYTNAGVTAFYVAIGSSTNKPPSTNPTFWQVTGSSSTYVNLGAYNGATAYFPGNQVSYNPSGGGSQYWICISQTTGNAPTQASSFWELVGTSAANLNGLDGVSPVSGANGLNLIFNGDFSIATVPTGVQSATASAVRVQDLANGGGIQPSCNGWTRNFENGGNGDGVIYQFPTVAGAGLVGPYSMILQDRTSSTGDVFAAVSDAFSVRQNTPYTFAANVNPGYGGPGGIPTHAEWVFRTLWYQVGTTDFSRASATLISFVDVVANSTASGPQAPSATVISPNNAGYCRIAFYHNWDGTPPATGWNLAVSNVRCVEPIDPSSLGQILAKGSTPSSLSSGFTYTSTTTTVTLFWSGLTIFRADGSTTAIANSSQLITGLTASSSFRIYPYFDELSGTLGFVTGGVGSPAICQTAGSNAISQAQNLQTRVPLSASNGFTVTTPASGSGGGSGGGSGNCVFSETLVESKRGSIKAIDVQLGDELRSENGWEVVTRTKVMPCEIWVHVLLVSGEEVLVSPSHPFTLADGSDVPMKRSADLSLADFLRTTRGIGAIRSISVIEEKGQKVSLTTSGPTHTFYAGVNEPSLLCHNFLPS
jgi:hypothetical protein